MFTHLIPSNPAWIQQPQVGAVTDDPGHHGQGKGTQHFLLDSQVGEETRLT